MAASSVSYSSRRVALPNGHEWLEVTAEFTCDSTDGSFTTTALYEDDTQQTAGNVLETRGFFLHDVAYYVGDTAVTDASDLELLESSATGIDVLVGNGANQLDATSDTYFTNLIGTIPHPVPIFDDLYLKITQAEAKTNSADGTLVFRFIR